MEFRCGDLAPVTFTPTDADALGVGADMAEDAFESAKKVLGGPQATVEAGRKALRELHKVGVDLLMLLAGGNGDDVRDLHNLFANAWDPWPEPWERIPEIQITAPKRAFPFELLPVFDPISLDDHFELATAGRRFLGLATSVSRWGDTPAAQDLALELDRDQRLRVQFLRHHMRQTDPRPATRMGSFMRRLRQPAVVRESGTDREYAHLKALPLRLDGPWPNPPLEEPDVVEHVVNALFDPTLDLNGGSQDDVPPAQIQHFACHCDTEAKYETGYRLRLTTAPGKVHHVLYSHISHGYVDGDKDLAPSDRSVVVFNACRSSHVNLASAGSFPSLFLANRHRAFVGTHVNVPDTVGAEWARRFYGHLLGADPCTLGKATVRAARDLLADWNNPLGLGYAVYGQTAVAVKWPGQEPPDRSAG